MLAGPPFEEHEAVARVRAAAERLARSPLPIYVAGEPGTGRRTLALAIARMRAGDSGTVVQFEAQRSPTDRPSANETTVVLVDNPECLDRRAQLALSTSIAAGGIVVSWGAAEWLERCEPELRPHLWAGLIALPPLRERGHDAVTWARFLLRRDVGDGEPMLSHDCEGAIVRYRWPGNLTELETTLHRAIALHDGSTEVEAEELGLANPKTQDAAILPLEVAIEHFRRDYVRRTLERMGGNRSQTAHVLGVDPRTVFRYLEKERDAK